MTEAYKKAFPEWSTIEVDLPEGIIDVSYGNDVCPSFQHPQFPIRIWIDEADPDKRMEMYGDRTHKRFWVEYDNQHSEAAHNSKLMVATETVDANGMKYGETVYNKLNSHFCEISEWSDALSYYHHLVSECYKQKIPQGNWS